MTMLLHSRLSSTLKWALVFLVGSVGLGATETVYAVPRYSASIPGVETVSNSPIPVSLSNLDTGVDYSGAEVIGQWTRGGTAAAGYGTLMVNSFADYLNIREGFPLSSGSGAGAQESSNFFLDNLVITGPPGNILVSFNFAISGGVFADNGGSPYFQSNAGATARVINLQSSFGGFGVDLGGISVDGYGNRSATGIFSTFPANSVGTYVGTTPSILTFAGDSAIQFWLGLDTGAGVYVGHGAGRGSAYGSSDFSHTFGFPTSGPVANLPEGYSLNSTDGYIVDNRFIGPTQPIPIPATYAMLLVGLGLLGFVERRRQRNVAA